MLFFHSFSRMLLVLLNSSSFSELNVSSLINWWFFGLRFDLFTIFLLWALVLVPFFLFDFTNKKIFLNISNVIFFGVFYFIILLNLIDVAYFPFIHHRSTLDLFFQIGGQTDVFSLLPHLIYDFYYLFIIYAALVWLFYFFMKKTTWLTTFYHIPISWKYKVFQIFLLAGILLVGIRGTNRVPLDTVDALKYAIPEHTHALLNTPFTIIKSFEKSKSNDDFLNKMVKANHGPGFNFLPDNLKKYKNKNVIIFIMESFAKEYTSLSGVNESFTPFLDSLMEHSFVFNQIYANGLKSIDGIPAILSSIPSLLDDPFINSKFNYIDVHSFASLLKKMNYRTLFMHGGFNGTMNFDAYAKSAEYDVYLGKDEYPDKRDFDGAWGIWDEPYLEYAGHVMDTLKQPFHVALFTLSSHHPFQIPEKYKGKFKKGSYENLESVQYADHALKLFFLRNKNKPWFKNALFILTADHTSLSGHPFYANIVGLHAIPLLIYDPSVNKKNIISCTGNQTDILPTVMDYLDFPYPFYSLGNSLFRNSINHHAIFYYSDMFYIVKDSLVCAWNKQTDSLYYFDLYLQKKNDLTPFQREELRDALFDYLNRFASLLRNGGSKDFVKNRIQSQEKSP